MVSVVVMEVVVVLVVDSSGCGYVRQLLVSFGATARSSLQSLPSTASRPCRGQQCYLSTASSPC